MADRGVEVATLADWSNAFVALDISMRCKNSTITPLAVIRLSLSLVMLQKNGLIGVERYLDSDFSLVGVLLYRFNLRRMLPVNPNHERTMLIYGLC